MAHKLVLFQDMSTGKEFVVIDCDERTDEELETDFGMRPYDYIDLDHVGAHWPIDMALYPRF